MKIIAHRSGPSVYPEQTVASAKYALKYDIQAVELDTRFTKDGAIVVSHDSNALRVYGVDKPVADMTVSEFLSLRHKDNPGYSAHRFSDYLENNIFPLLVHVKEGEEKIYPLLEEIHRYNYDDKVILGITIAKDIKRIREFNPDIRILGFIPGITSIDDFADADYIRLWEKWLSDDSIAAVHKTGKKLWVMAGNFNGIEGGYTDFNNFEKWEEMGIDGVLINEVDSYFQWKNNN